MPIRIVAWALAVMGAALLALNVYGLTTDYVIPSAAQRFRIDGANAELRTGSLLRRAAEPEPAYFRRLAASIRARMAYYWDAREAVALTDNFVLHFAQYVAPSYRAYEFSDADRALRRGFGLCSQDANIAFDVLKGQGFHPRTVLLPRHTFVAARTTGGREMIVDADFGIVIPRSLVELQARPALVRPHYEALDPLNTPVGRRSKSEVGNRMVRAFSDRPVAINTGSATPDTATIEPIAYLGKWTLPMVLLVAGIVLLLRPLVTARRQNTS